MLAHLLTCDAAQMIHDAALAAQIMAVYLDGCVLLVGVA